MKQYSNIQNKLFMITIIFFLIGMIHISLSLFGLLCFLIPFVYYFRYREQIWCKYRCPRAGFFQTLISKINIGLKPPKFLTKKRFQKGVVIYFGINLFFVTMSTIMVALGRVEAIEQVRFLIVFGLPIQLPQLLSLAVPTFLIHLGYRIYSMMFTSVVIGMILGILYRPRTWCAICPIRTLTVIKKQANETKQDKVS